MKASELRSGNFIKLFKNGKPHLEWYELDSHDIYKLDESNCEDVQPIPLTEEWFKNFGFEIRYFNNDENLPIWWKVIKNRHIDIYPHTEHGFYFLINSIQMSVPIITVHQLQNLYFALCGEELELK